MKGYNDTFVEQLVRRSRPGGETLFKIGAVLAGLVLSALAFWWLGAFFAVIFTVIVILEFFVFVTR
jgi:CHASE2 domain-containing sensor protein